MSKISELPTSKPRPWVLASLVRAEECGADGGGDGSVKLGAQHQSLLHFVGEAPWSDERVLAKVRETVLPAIERHRPIGAWIIDDTGFPKQGGTRLAWRGNTAAKSASRIIVRLLF